MKEVFFKKIKSGKIHTLMDSNNNVYIIDKNNKITNLGKYKDFDINQDYLVLLDNDNKIYFYNIEDDMFKKIDVMLDNSIKINKIGCYGEALVALDEDGVIWYEDIINRDVKKYNAEKFVDISTSFLLFHAKSENGNLYGYGINGVKQLHPLIDDDLCVEIVKINHNKVKSVFTNQHISFYVDENDLLHILTNEQDFYDKKQHYINEFGEVVLKKDIKVKKVINYLYNIFLLDDKNNLYRYILKDNNNKPTYSLQDTGIDCLDVSLYKNTLFVIDINNDLYTCNNTIADILKLEKLL